MVGELGEGFGGGETDTNRDADPLFDGVPDLLAVIDQIDMPESVEAEKTLVDALDFLFRRESTEDVHHATAEVGIEFVVTGERHDAVLFGQVLHLEPGGAHLDAKGFDFGAAGDGTAVVVSE